jgi:proteasome assembly chaperone 3
MGLPFDAFDNMDGGSALPFPAPSKQTAGEINGIKTDVTCLSFSDKIMITVTQQGRLAQWVGPFSL